jgi:hypothetical protein
MEAEHYAIEDLKTKARSILAAFSDTQARTSSPTGRSGGKCPAYQAGAAGHQLDHRERDRGQEYEPSRHGQGLAIAALPAHIRERTSAVNDRPRVHLKPRWSGGAATLDGFQSLAGSVEPIVVDEQQPGGGQADVVKVARAQGATSPTGPGCLFGQLTVVTSSE